MLHGALSYLLQDDAGQVHPAHSISAGLDYPGVGPEHSYLKDSGRATYVVGARRRGAATDSRLLSRLEGIIPALETAHAVAWIDARARPLELRRRGAALRQRSRRQGRRAGDGNGYPGRVTHSAAPLPRGSWSASRPPFEPARRRRAAASSSARRRAPTSSTSPTTRSTSARTMRCARRSRPCGRRRTSSCSASPRPR